MEEQNYSGIVQMVPFIVVVAAMFWMMNASSRKEKKKKAEMMSSLQKGVKVQSVGGIIGTIEEIRDDEVQVLIDPRSKASMTLSKASVASVL